MGRRVLLAPTGSPNSASILRYTVAVLSILLALIPALLLSGVVETRLVVFAVAIMVSAWYGGWRPGLVATAFAVTVSAYFSAVAARAPGDYERAVLHLALFVVVALLICWFNAALRAAQDALCNSESNLRSQINHAPYGICRTDSAGILLDVNPALTRILRYESAAELVGLNLANQYVDPQQWFTLRGHFQCSNAFRGSLAQWVCKGGSSVVVRLSGRAIHGENNAIFFEFFIEDVTATQELEQQLRQAQKMEAVGRLAGGIAHDFNNLLMVISGYCEFLLEVGPEPHIRASVQEIANAAERATALTRQLLAFSRKQMLAPKLLDLNEIITRNLNMLTRMIGEDVELVMRAGVNIGAVKADPSQIEQVIMNLAVNARDAMPQGGKLIIETVNIVNHEEHALPDGPLTAGEYVMLSISDTGVGMDTETQSHIFEPFFTTKGIMGTGLGLSTVYGIIQQSGGTIRVSSDLGKGTTFKIYLPRADSKGEVVGPERALGMAEAGQGLETILLVEDEISLRALSRQYLQNQGYTVLDAADGAAALTISSMHDGPIHLLLTDVIMPGMNGRELAGRIRAMRPQTKVLFMSGYSENAVSQEALLEEGIALLQKPFALSALGIKVRKQLSSAMRAKRLNLQLPLKYRQPGEPAWSQGTTENISRSGMLFRTEKPLIPQLQLEIKLVLPPEITGLPTAEVVCRGQVVRALSSDTGTTSPVVAAKILHYEFPHGTNAHAQ